MSRLRLFLLLIAAQPFLGNQLLGSQPSGVTDPAFEKIPFNQWLAETNSSHSRWTAHVSHPVLSFHQRLLSQIEIEVDGRDLEAHRGDEELVTFFQLTDQQGKRYQGHSSVQLGNLDPNIKAAAVQSVQQPSSCRANTILPPPFFIPAPANIPSTRQTFAFPRLPQNLLRSPGVNFPPSNSSPPGNPPKAGICPKSRANTLGLPASALPPISTSFSTSRRKPRLPAHAALPAMACPHCCPP